VVEKLERPQRIKIKPEAYLDAIARRAKRLDGVISVRAQMASRYTQAVLWISFRGDHDFRVPVLLEDSVDDMRREFATRFPEIGISVNWSMVPLTRVVPVVHSYIEGDRILQELKCGHIVKGERIRKKRQCQCCAETMEQREVT
jgi:hypothetical protein